MRTIAILFLSWSAFGQISDVAITGRLTVDFSNATAVKPTKSGTSLPATCAVSEVYFKTDATAGQNLYYCTAPNTWVQQLNSGSSGGVADCGANGYMVRTALNTTVCRTFQAGAGISLSLPTGVTGDTVITNTGTASVAGLADCKVSIAGAVATIASPCNYSAGGIIKTLASDATATLSGTNASSTVQLYHSATGALIADESSVATLTCNAFCAVAITGGFPTQSEPIAIATFVNNSFTAVTDFRSAFSGKTILAGTCLTPSIDSNGQVTLSVNTATCVQTIDASQQNTNTSCIIASASTTAYVCTPPVPYASQTDNTTVVAKIDVQNTGTAPTMAVSGLTAKVMYKRNGTSAPAQIAAGELRANTNYNFVYDTSLNTSAGGWLTDVGGGGGSNTVEYYVATVGCTGDGGNAAFGPGWGPFIGSAGSAICGSGFSTGQGLQAALSFIDGADTYVTYAWLLPSNFVALVSITFDYVSPTTSGNFAGYYAAACYSSTTPWLAGTAPTYNPDALFALTPAAANFATVQLTHATTNVDSCTAGKHLSLKIGRTGTDGIDTSTQTMYILGISIKYTVN